jgi:tRNA pseudouridine38-40 synthase
VSILDLKKKNLNFSARFNAKLRTYEYFIINRLGTLSINKNKAWHIKKILDLQLMKKGAKVFEGTHNFGTCRASSCSAKSAIKKVYPIKVTKLKDKIKIRISSKSFLQNQVRSMIGCLKYLSTGKWSYLKFKKAFKSKNRSNCAPPAPAHGLYLLDIKY